MHSRVTIGALHVVMGLLIAGCATPLERQQLAEARPFAEAWLGYLDAGEQELAWDATADLAKLRLEKPRTLKLWFGSRSALGERISQKLEVSWETEDYFLKAVPEGNYWELQFTSDFEKQREVRERLFLVWESGQWRLLEYAIR